MEDAKKYGILESIVNPLLLLCFHSQTDPAPITDYELTWIKLMRVLAHYEQHLQKLTQVNSSVVRNENGTAYFLERCRQICTGLESEMHDFDTVDENISNMLAATHNFRATFQIRHSTYDVLERCARLLNNLTNAWIGICNEKRQTQLHNRVAACIAITTRILDRHISQNFVP